MKKIWLNKDSIDELNEIILNTVEPGDLDEEMKRLSELDVYVDVELDIFTVHLEKKTCPPPVELERQMESTPHERAR